jgi:UDP-glucuronate 4-epimerase
MKNTSKEKILVTGCAGFIGMHLCSSLLESGYLVLGIDNINEYYDSSLKLNRLKVLQNYEAFSFEKIDITDSIKLNNYFKINKPEKVVNLAAQAGVRNSITNPNSYIQSNVVGFMNILEACRHNDVKGLIYASSSSVYGGNNIVPFVETHKVENPTSIYAATKKSNELMARSYYNLFGLKSTGLRFFTVYGPWGRPDMAYFIFTKNISKNKPIEVFNSGDMIRDFTYVDDIIAGIKSAIINNYNSEIFNLGNNKTEKITQMIKIIENKLNIKAKVELKPMQLGDIKKTYADVNKAKLMLNYKPSTKFKNGMEIFIDWFCDYYKL